MKKHIFPLLALIMALVFNNFISKPIHAGELPTIKNIYGDRGGVQKEVDVSLPSGSRAEIKIGSKGKVYTIDEYDNTQSLIADIEVTRIIPDGIARAKRIKGSDSIKIKTGDIVRFESLILPDDTGETSSPFSVVNHLMTGITKEEFHNAYKECATPPQKYTFFDTDRCATQWFSYQNATPGDTITWKWYKPDGYLYSEDKGVVDTVEGCWISDLNIVYNVSYYPVQWQVKVYRNGQFLFSDTFTISKPPPPPVQVSVVNHLVTGISQDEFHGKYSGCVTPPQKYNFLDTDLYATQWCSCENSPVGDTFKWEWYSPDGYLYWTDSVTVIHSEGCLSSYLHIKGYSASFKLGQWQVKVYRNGQFLFSDTFTISKRT